MLYSLLIAVILMAFLMPILGIFCFVQGFNLSAKKNGSDVKLEPIKAIKKPKIRVESEEIKRVNKILQNIDNYQGNSQGQIRVE